MSIEHDDFSNDGTVISNSENESVISNRRRSRSGETVGKHYDYVFTLNNYNDTMISAVKRFAEAECTYLVYQHERGESGTPHLQGFFRFQSRRSFSAVLARLKQGGLRGIHLEPRRGTIAQAVEYCTRESKRDERGGQMGIVEFGTKPAGQGSRTDIKGALGLVRSGASPRALFEAHPEVMVKFSRGMAEARLAYQQPRREKTIVKWYYGSTGTGKSRAANDEAPDAYWKAGGSKWWCGYNGQDVVIVDDYRCDLCTFSNLLRLFDRYPLLVEGKGVSMQFVSKTIIVTAPRRPEVMWSKRTEEDLGQLLRRIEEIRLFGEEPREPAVLPTFNR